MRTCMKACSTVSGMNGKLNTGAAWTWLLANPEATCPMKK